MPVKEKSETNQKNGDLQRHGEHMLDSTANRVRPPATTIPPLPPINPALRPGMLAGRPYGFRPPPMMGAPSYYEMALWNQRLVMEEQTRMMVMAQAAGLAEMRARRNLRCPPSEALGAQERLRKRRKLSGLPPTLRSKMPTEVTMASSFPLPRKANGASKEATTCNLEVGALDMYRERWDKLSEAAGKLYKDNEECRKAFVRHYFAKSLETSSLHSRRRPGEAKAAEDAEDEGADKLAKIVTSEV